MNAAIANSVSSDVRSDPAFEANPPRSRPPDDRPSAASRRPRRLGAGSRPATKASYNTPTTAAEYDEAWRRLLAHDGGTAWHWTGRQVVGIVPLPVHQCGRRACATCRTCSRRRSTARPWHNAMRYRLGGRRRRQAPRGCGWPMTNPPRARCTTAWLSSGSFIRYDRPAGLKAAGRTNFTTAASPASGQAYSALRCAAISFVARETAPLMPTPRGAWAQSRREGDVLHVQLAVMGTLSCGTTSHAMPGPP